MLAQAVIGKVMMKWPKISQRKEPWIALGLGRSLSDFLLSMINGMIHIEPDESYR